MSGYRIGERIGRLTGLAGMLMLVLVAMTARPAAAQRAEAARLFEEGNALYRQGDYAGAADAYRAALDRGYASGALYYNLGNAYFRQDELGQAIRYYLKARRWLPHDRAVQHNLAIARARTVDDIAQRPEPFWKPAWQALLRVLGAGGLFALGMGCYLTAVALAGYWLWTRRRNEWVRRGLVVAGVAAVLLLAAAFLASLTPQLDRRAVLVADAAVLHEAPAPETATALILHEGLTLSILRTQGPWAEVELPNGATGWIEASALADV
ncbi:MAG: tetratricopeptide repeat protein [Bacteroidetes bacterium]|nr:hypothetical protein AWN76_009670 [Rhodothermaceae bacterium RA]RMH49123.1 MAG: tetratricopeptide repeat protein [Bacteroidota bacterium]